MPRKGNTPKREVLPDPVYGSVVVAKLINSIMLDGKKGVAQNIVYTAFDRIKETTGEEPLEVFEKAMNNIMPVLEVKARRIGGANYQVPIEVRPERRQTLGLRWLTKYTRLRGEKTMSERLAKELMDAAEEYHKDLYFEAAVGGGIPIIRPLKECLAGNNITEVMGIVNGTTNYILTKMTQEGMDFGEALKQAQELGFAEADPTADVEGYDACRKIAILSSLAYERYFDFEDIYTEGITKITAEDFCYAAKMKKSIKLLGSSWKTDDKFYAMVCPMLLDNEHPLAGVKDVFNAIFVRGNMVDETMFYGKGAGKLPTASAVAADVIDCAKHIGKNIKILWEPEKLTLSDLGNFERKYFVRMPKKQYRIYLEQ